MAFTEQTSGSGRAALPVLTDSAPSAQEPSACEVLTSYEVEQLLRMAPGWAAKNRMGLTGGETIPFFRVGRRVIRYRVADVQDYVAAAMRTKVAA